MKKLSLIFLVMLITGCAGTGMQSSGTSGGTDRHTYGTGGMGSGLAPANPAFDPYFSG